MSKSAPMLATLITLATAPVVAQSPSAASATFRTGVDVVTLTVTVTDRADHAISDLTRNDFALREDGVEQPVTFFGGADVPLDLALVIDASASMGGAPTSEASTRRLHASWPRSTRSGTCRRAGTRRASGAACR